MWGSTYSPRQYVERHKSLPVVLSRLYGSTKNGTAYTSTYGVWNDDYGCRGNGLWDDVLFHRSKRENGGSRSASQRRIVCQPISKVTIPRRQFRFESLAAPKISGCGPNCKKSRCAATIEYAKPYCGADNRKGRKGTEKRFRTSAFQGTEKNIYTTMANIHVQDRIRKSENHDITMGLKNLKKVKESGDLEDLPIGEQNCERNCGECSDSPMEVATNINPESTNGNHGDEMKSSTTRTVGSNTEKYCERVDYEIPVRVLKDVDNNIMSELLQNATSPIPRVKLPTPIPRVALLKPPMPMPYKHLNKLARRMVKSTVERDQLPTPLSLTSRRVTPRKMPPQTQKLMPPGKLVPRLFTPPTSIPFTRTPTPRSQSSIKQEKPQQETELQLPKPVQNPIQNESSNQSSKKSSKQSSEQTSKADSLMTTTSEFDTSSNPSSCKTDEHFNQDCIAETLTPMYCICRLCGKSESITDCSQLNRATVYHNNPLYSPQQSLRRRTDSSLSTATFSRLFYTLLEVLIWLMLGGALTLGLIPYVESVFRAYVADFCLCSDKGKSGAGPELIADGMKSSVVKWVTCMMDDSRATLMPLR